VERLTEINNLWNVASCWLYPANILAMHGPMNVLSNSLLYTLWRYNGKDSTDWLWFGSFWNVRLAYRIHYSWWTTHTTFLTNENLGSLYIKEIKHNSNFVSMQYKHCIHNMFKYTKSSEVNAQKNKHMKMMQTFFLSSGTMFQEVPKRKGSFFCRILDGKKEEKMWHWLPFF